MPVEQNWLDFMTGTGMTGNAANYFCTYSGVTSVTTYRTQIAITDFEAFWIALVKSTTTHSFSWSARKKMHAFRLYLEYVKACGISENEDVHIDQFGANAEAWVNRLAELSLFKEQAKQDRDSIEVPKLKSLGNEAQWTAFKQMMETKLKNERNPILGHPLYYLIGRENATSRQTDIDADYPTIDDRLYACVDLDGPLYTRDNK